TVASVGPYALMSVTFDAQRSASRTLTASPATTTVPATNGSPAASQAASADGGRVTCVTPWRATVASSGRPGIMSSRVARHRVAPLARVLANSETLASKLGDANWRT